MDKNICAPCAPMGWNSYDYYNTEINEMQVRANAEYMAAHLREYGWEYIVIDISWYEHGSGSRSGEYQYLPFAELEMDAYSRLIPVTERYPSSADGAGFRPLADYIHSLGLKFGIHIMRGIPRLAAHRHMPILGTDLTADEIADPANICSWNPYMYGLRPDIPESQLYYDSLFELYARWGVDFVKCDDICREDASTAHAEIGMLHKAIEKCGRPIVLSLSPGPAKITEAEWYAENANMWRITDDFWDSWPLLKDMFRRCELWQGKKRPGCYPDCDMLPMLGAEMTRLDAETLKLLTNRELISLQQHGERARQIMRSDEQAVWTAYDPQQRRTYIAIFNLSEEERGINCWVNQIASSEEGSYRGQTLHELWTGRETVPHAGGLAALIPAHGVRLFWYSNN